jgi:hypothetical protein
MKPESKVHRQLTRLLGDTRFILCAAAVATWWLVLPDRVGCSLVYLATPWGQASVLFVAALLLWIGHPVTRLASVGLSALMAHAAGVSISYNWQDFAYLPGKPFLAWGDEESWGYLLLRFSWDSLLVAALATTIAAYAITCLARSHARRPSLP